MSQGLELAPALPADRSQDITSAREDVDMKDADLHMERAQDPISRDAQVDKIFAEVIESEYALLTKPQVMRKCWKVSEPGSPIASPY